MSTGQDAGQAAQHSRSLVRWHSRPCRHYRHLAFLTILAIVAIAAFILKPSSCSDTGCPPFRPAPSRSLCCPTATTSLSHHTPIPAPLTDLTPPRRSKPFPTLPPRRQTTLIPPRIAHPTAYSTPTATDHRPRTILLFSSRHWYRHPSARTQRCCAAWLEVCVFLVRNPIPPCGDEEVKEGEGVGRDPRRCSRNEHNDA
jgi:hypothetical protein